MVPVTRTSKQRRRHLPDLCLLKVFGLMPLEDRLSAHNVSTRWGQLVREASRPVSSLTVAVGYEESIKNIEKEINYKSIATQESVKLLKKEDGCTPLYSLHRTTKWNCLKFDPCQLDSATVKQILDVFFATTELIFVIKSHKDDYGKNLKKMLHDHRWRSQLTTFKLIVVYHNLKSKGIFKAINALSVLRHLTINICDETVLQDWPILAQLKEVHIDSFMNSENKANFLRSLNRHTTENGNLRVYLNNFYIYDFDQLDDHLRDRIARVNYCFNESKVLSICGRFRFLESLSLDVSPSPQLFTLLSQQNQLVHLCICLDFSELPTFDETVRLLAQLNSVKALDLALKITSHFQVKWLNLRWTVPNVQVIHLYWIDCESCQTYTLMPYDDASKRDTAHQCLCSALKVLQKTGVPSHRIICTLPDDSIATAEQLLQPIEEVDLADTFFNN